MLQVALVTCRPLPDLHTDDRLLLEPLAALDCRATAVAWDTDKRYLGDLAAARFACGNHSLDLGRQEVKEAGRAPQRGEPGLSRRLVLLTVYAEERGLRA